MLTKSRQPRRMSMRLSNSISNHFRSKVLKKSSHKMKMDQMKTKTTKNRPQPRRALKMEVSKMLMKPWSILETPLPKNSSKVKQKQSEKRRSNKRDRRSK